MENSRVPVVDEQVYHDSTFQCRTNIQQNLVQYGRVRNLYQDEYPMTSDELKAIQTPLKARYREDPASAVQTMRVEGRLSPGDLTVHINTIAGPISAGLHAAAGGPGTWACSGDMLLEALVACAGVTLTAVATAMKIAFRGGRVTAEGEIDFRGTLGVSKEVPVGFTAIRLHFDIDADATDDQLKSLATLTDRYCVIAQSLKNPPVVTIELLPSTSALRD